jgi:hypothetical protein
LQEKEEREGQGQRAKEEHMPPLQKIPLQEVPLRQTGQMHVEKEIQRIPLQVNLQ